MKAKPPIWIPIVFTIGYFVYAFATPISGIWLVGLIRTFLVSAAAVCALGLWGAYLALARAGSRRPVTLTAIALLPVAALGAFDLYSATRARHLAALAARISTDARLIRIEDEELVTARGNAVGVRLRYEIRYPEGSAELIPHEPPANLSLLPSPYLTGFWICGTQAHALSPTEYVMTTDVVPEFMPNRLRFPTEAGNPGGGASDPCFSWTRGAVKRAELLAAPAQPFWITLSVPRYAARTQHSYDLRRFYEGALKEGAKECP